MASALIELLFGAPMIVGILVWAVSRFINWAECDA